MGEQKTGDFLLSSSLAQVVEKLLAYSQKGDENNFLFSHTTLLQLWTDVNILPPDY